MQYRGKFDIVNKILRVCSKNGGKKKTIIMRDVGLSFSQTKTYLPRMLSAELIETRSDGNGGGVSYVTIDKGWEFMKIYNEVSRLVN